jgi:crossover junction endodeoxyribonuclease RuvC
MRVLGIDPGLATTGYGVLESSEGGFKLLEAGVIKTSIADTTSKRLKNLYLEIRQIIKEFKPDVMAVEEVFFSKNTKTAMAVSQARGVILLAGDELVVRSYTPLQVKRAIVGYGRAKKAQVQKVVGARLKIKEAPKQSDAADALAVALCSALELENVKVRT